MKNPLLQSGFLFILTLTLALPCAAQRVEKDIKFRLAESYERGGDYESALKLYNELYAKDSTNVVIFDALRRDYLLLKRYDDAIALFQRALVNRPNDIGLLAQLGTFYTQKNDERNAAAMWERALAVMPGSEQTYRIVASTMTESRLFDKAIGVYQRARTACDNPNLFTSEIAQLYAINLNYAGAAGEYLNLLRQSPGMLSFVQSRMAAFTDRPEGLSAAVRAVEEAVKHDPDSLTFLQLQAWLYMEGKQYNQAYDVYRLIDARTKAGGRELYNFAEHALKEKSYAAAARAFQDVIAGYPNFEMRPQASFGFAHTLEDSATAHDTADAFASYLDNPIPASSLPHAYDDIIAAYRSVISQYPATLIAGQSLLRIAALQQERQHDFDGAQSSLETLNRQYAAFPGITLAGTLRLGDVFLAKGDLDKAEAAYTSLAGYAGAADEKERGAYRLAEVDYYRGKFKEATGKLKALSLNVVADIANDAMKMQVFIADNTASGDEPLKQYAEADFLKRQLKFDQAVNAFREVMSSFPNSTLVDEALMNIGDIQLETKRYADGIASYERLLHDFPESLSLDLAMVKIGAAYDLGLHDAAKAIETYQQLLQKYPNSIYVEQVRQRIRILRGDTI